MEIIPKENTESFFLPLPIYKSIHIADAVLKDGEEFKIVVGFDENLVAQLTKYSKDLSDIELQKNTPDIERFAEGAYEDWYKKIRTPFGLVYQNTGALAAIVWLGPRPLNNEADWHTVGWRSYNPWRGKGVMRDFANFAIKTYLKNFPTVKLWITAKDDNSGSIRLAEALGFEKINSNREQSFIEMIKK